MNIKEVKKLKIVKYNKSLQNALNLKLINYKYFTGRYIIYGPNGEGKEYNTGDDNLVFEGEYLKGERNGKGKEYNDKGKLEFEGEYLNGKKLKGKEYHENGKIAFEGEYLNGKKLKGKGYDEKGKIIYELNSENNDIKEYYHNGQLIYEGKYLNGERNGKGKVYYEDGKLLFEGEYRSDIIWNGRGYDEKGNIIYELKNGRGYLKRY